MFGTKKMSKMLGACFTALGMIAAVAPASATTFSIDDFSIVRTRAGVTTSVFSDNFNNNLDPTNPPYFINGTTGVEAGGRYSFDPVNNGAIFDAVGPGQTYVSSARFNPAVTINSLNLSSTDIFTVTGVFDLIAPTLTRESYGIRLNDAGIPSTNNLNDRLEILVRRLTDGTLAIVFRDSDSFTDISTLLGQTDLETNHDQIVLQLSKLGAAVNAITASFAYVDGGIVGAFTTFTNTGTLFDGENFTRAEFRATTPVPIAPTLSLTLLGLATMFAARKKKA